MERLGYLRNEHAFEYPIGARRNSDKSIGPDGTSTSDVVGNESQASISVEIRVHGSSLLLQLLVGTRVGIISQGREIATGALDMVSADGSTAWIWLDGGGGRRLVHAGDGIGLTALEDTAFFAAANRR